MLLVVVGVESSSLQHAVDLFRVDTASLGLKFFQNEGVTKALFIVQVWAMNEILCPKTWNINSKNNRLVLEFHADGKSGTAGWDLMKL